MGLATLNPIWHRWVVVCTIESLRVSTPSISYVIFVNAISRALVLRHAKWKGGFSRVFVQTLENRKM